MFQASISSLSHFRSLFLDQVIHFCKNLGDQLKGRFPKKLKSLSICSAPENTGSSVKFVVYLYSVESSWTELSISGKIRRLSKGSFSEKAKIVESVSLCRAP